MSEMEWNKDRFGADYASFPLPTDNPKSCEDACRSDAGCKAWTFVKPNTIRGPSPMCYLKNAVPPPQDNAACVSGIKNGCESDGRRAGHVGRPAVAAPEVRLA